MSLTKIDNIQIKNKPVVSVKEYGVIGDGITDDTAAMQLAVDSGNDIIIDGNIIVTDFIVVPSNTTIYGGNGSWIKNTDTTLGDNGGRPMTYNGVFLIEGGSTNITIDSVDIRGAWYGTTQPYRDQNIGINIRGGYDYYYHSVGNLNISSNITIKDCKIEGFAQSGVIADNIDNFKAVGNTIKNCGRDGIRMYGCVNFDTSHNTIDNMSPGYDGIAPNYNVYGIAATTVYALPLASYRSSEKGIISNNNVSNCSTWKSLDTHGGRDIIFSGNTCLNSHIGIGIDKGGYDDSSNLMPAERITISNNVLRNTQGDTDLKRAGISVFAHSNDAIQIGKDVVIDGNYIEGFGGQTKDGGITLSMQKDVIISNNIFVDNYYSGVFAALDCTNVQIMGNIFRNVIESSTGVKDGIATASCVGFINISDNTFMTDNGLPFRPINIPNSVSLDIHYTSSNKSIGTDAVAGLLYSAGGKILENKAYGLVLSNGATSGIYGATVAYVSTGRYDITLTDTSLLKIMPTVNVYTGTLNDGGATIRALGSNTFTVLTFDATGTLADTSFTFQVMGY